LAARRSLGRQFGWLWAAYAVSAYGSGLGFGAFPLIAVLVVHASAAQVSELAAVGPAVGAVIALPLGPWVEFRRKRPVMIAMDLARFAVMMTIPVAYALGCLTFVQLLLVSAVVAAAKIAFSAASGSCLRALVSADDLLVANARFESTTWSSIAVGPPLGGAAIGVLGPVTTVLADAASYLFSGLAITAIRDTGERPRRAGRGHVLTGDVLDGWRHILAHPVLRALYLNNLLVAGLIMSTEPLLAVLLLRQLGFAPWQYGLAFALPCAGGFIGSRLARRVVTRYGQRRVLRAVGTLRAVWLIGLAFIRPGVAGLATVTGVELAIIFSMSLYNPVLATCRLEQTPRDKVARVLSAWSIGQQAAIALCAALGGLLADLTSTRTALMVAGLLILASPLLLPGRRSRASQSFPQTGTGSRLQSLASAGRSRTAAGRERGQPGLDVGRDRVGRLVGVDRDEDSPFLVVGNERIGRLRVHPEPVPDHVGPVVGAPAVAGAVQQPLRQHRRRRVQVNGRVQRHAQPDGELGRGGGLRKRAREAVQDVAAGGGRVHDDRREHVQHDLIGDEVTAGLAGRDLIAQPPARPRLRPQEVAGGDMPGP
jgi:hypothetical protein